jgi:hypothetical protein
MFPTAEVRWFTQGAIPSEVLRWFHESGKAFEEQPLRVDYYLRIVEGESLGVKLREGRLEIKQRQGKPEIVHFDKHIIGWVERWRKWSFELAGTSSVLDGMRTSANHWIGVRKERKLRTYLVTGKGSVTSDRAGGNILHGCGWELAKIGIGGIGEAWWSLGFEAFGLEVELRDILLHVAGPILRKKATPIFDLDNSYGYPRWLKIAWIS